MEPPHYEFQQPEPPKKKNKTLLWVMIGICTFGCCVLILPAVLFPVFAQARQAAKRTETVKNVKVLATAALVYSQDHDDKLPLADNWCDALEGMVSDQKSFQSALAGPPSGERWDFCYSEFVAGKNATKLTNPGTLVLLFESISQEKNQFGHAEMIAERNNQTCMAFADGSARVVKGDQLGSLLASDDPEMRLK